MKFDKSFHGTLRLNPVNPRYFTDDSGKAVYLTGSHTWTVMQDVWLPSKPPKQMDYAGFLQMMEDNGHNFLRFWQHLQLSGGERASQAEYDPLPYNRSGQGKAADGLPKLDLSDWNEAYFARLRQRVQQAGEKGIYVSIMFFEGCAIKLSLPEAPSWPYHPFNPANNVNGITDDPMVADTGKALDLFSLNCPQFLHWQKQFVMKVVDAVNDLDNVLFEISNEVPNRKEAFAWLDHMCAFVKQYESGKPKQHPVGITAEGGDQDNALLFATCADWISPGNGKVFEYRYNPPAADGRKVILNDTDHLWGHGGDSMWVWKSFTRGMNVLFMDPWEPHIGNFDFWRIDENVTYNQRYFHAWDPLRRSLGYTRYFAQRMNLNACEPRNDLCTSSYCLADVGNTYLCYLPAGGDEGLDLWNVEGVFALEWFNPATGLTTKGKDLKGNWRYVLSQPFSGPGVAFIYKK